jgi:hypothetical protein
LAESGGEEHPFVEPGVIVAILLLNAVIGVWQVTLREVDIVVVIDDASGPH